MKCFNHETKDSVVLCKACAKALCTDCFEDIGLGFACKNEKCIERAKLINQIMENNSKVLKVANKQMKTMGYSGTLTGIAFLIFAFVSYDSMSSSFIPYFLGMVGIVTFVSGLIRLRKKQQYPDNEK